MLAAGVAPMVVPSSLLGRSAPSNTLNLGFIGTGGHGTNYNLKHFLEVEGCKALVVCDAFRDRMEEAARITNAAYGNEDCRMVDDFREIMADDSLDAVVISTPDHWHVPMSLMGLAAGKHVFCEKPTYRIGEGRELVKAVAKSGKTFQTGLEDRSMIKYHMLIEWLRNGAIGDLYHVDVILPPGTINPAEDPAPVPEGLNWEMWLGPAPYHPYTPSRTGWLNWRYIRDYSTGVLTDWGAHLVDTAQLAVNDPHGTAVEVKAWGQPVPPNSETDIPAVYEVHYRYANGVTMSVKNSEGAEWLGQKATVKLLGAKGWVSVDGWNGPFGASDPMILRQKYEQHTSKHWQRPVGEHQNFIDCIRSGDEPTYTANTLHQLSTTLHMGLIAMDLERPLKWDPVKEEFSDDPEANQHTSRKLREDWKRA